MKLDIGTSLNLVFDPSYKKPITQQLDSVCGAGFKHIDMNFLDWCHGEKSPFTSENWQDWILQIKEYGEKSKITFHQAHAPMYSYKDGKSPLDFDEHFDKMTIRSIQAAGMLGVKWIIIHAGHYPHKPYNRSMSNQLKEANFAWFDQFVNEAQKWNVGIAIENMANVFAPKLEGIENEMYCSLHEDLLELVDGFKTDKVGICWDTGHANLQGLDQPDCLKAIGSRLKALHIADNNKLSDEHLAPYFGSIDWDGIMKALSDINYQGVFTFETHKHVHPFPEALRDDCIKLLYNIGNYLVNII